MTVTSITNKVGKQDISYFDGKSLTYTRNTSAGGTLTCYKVGGAIDILATYGSNANATSTTIIEALQGIGSSVYAVKFSPGNWTIDASFTIPMNLQVIIERGCIFQVSTGITVVMPVPLASRGKWIELTGTGVVNFSGPGEVMPDWWGNNTTPGTTDMLAALTSAVAAIGSESTDLTFNDEYYISDDLTISVNCHCIFPYNAKIKIASGKAVTFNGPITAGSYQIFNDANPTLNGVVVTTAIGFWQWWGSDATAYAAAIAAGFDPVQQISQKGAASGYASLNASSKVVENPASASLTAAANKIPLASAGGLLDVSWFGGAKYPGFASKLYVKPNAGVPATKIDIDADIVVVSDGTNYYAASAVNLTIDYSTTGANALDAGSISTGWYFNYVIYNPTSGTVAGLGSTSATSPTMPAGYTYKKLVSASYYDTTDFRDFRQNGNEYWYVVSIGVHRVDHATWVKSDSWDVNLDTAIPTVAWKIMGQFKGQGYGIILALSWDGAGSSMLKIFNMPATLGALSGFYVATDFEYMLNPSDSQAIYAAGLDTYARGDIYICGFKLDL